MLKRSLGLGKTSPRPLALALVTNMNSETFLERPPEMPQKSGLSGQVAFQKRSLHMLSWLYGLHMANLLTFHKRVAAHEMFYIIT